MIDPLSLQHCIGQPIISQLSFPSTLRLADEKDINDVLKYVCCDSKCISRLSSFKYFENDHKKIFDYIFNCRNQMLNLKKKIDQDDLLIHLLSKENSIDIKSVDSSLYCIGKLLNLPSYKVCRRAFQIIKIYYKLLEVK